MKKTFKILSLVLVLCFAVSSFTYANTFPDVSDNAGYAEAVSLLSALKIINGYEDGTFGPEREVTRAEFTTMLVRALGKSGLGSKDPAGLPFADLDGAAWAISDIRTAYDLKIINGMSETEFAPNAQVTVEQALKMIVCALGYYPMALQSVGGDVNAIWPSGYTNVASDLGIDMGVITGYNKPAKRSDIATFVFNSLEVDLMETKTHNGMERTEILKGTNLLNDKLRISYGYGELIADNKSSVDASGAVAREGEVTIYENDFGSNETFLVGSVKTEGLVGRSVKYYYKVDKYGEKTLVYLFDTTKSSSIVKIDPESLNTVTGTWGTGVEISYWKNETDRKATVIDIAEDPVISINGRVIDNSSKTPSEVFNIDSGSIELVSSANNGVFNKINIVSYVTYVVGSVSTSQKMVIDMYKTSVQGNTVILDADDDYTTLTMTRASNGSTVSLSSLSKYNVISVKQSIGANGRSVIDVIVSNESVTGNITALDLDFDLIGVDGKEYKLSKYAKTYVATQIDTLAINDSVKFYLDKDGNIAAFEKVASLNTTYAFICGVAAENETLAFRLIEQNGAKTSVTAASKIKIDGQPYQDFDAAETYLKGITDNIDENGINGSQLVKITKNNQGNITAVDTIAVGANDDLTLVKSNSSYEYKSSTNQFINGSNKFMVDSSTIIFAVPSTRTDYDAYSKKTLSSFKDGQSYSNIEAYDFTSGSVGKVKCIVVYGTSGGSALSADSPIIITTDKHLTTNSEGETVYNVFGYMFGQSVSNDTTEDDAFTKNTTKFDDAIAGDIYRVAYTGDDFNNYSEKLLSVSGSSMPSAFYREGVAGDLDSDYVVAHGLLVGADEDTFLLAKTNDLDDLINEDSYDEYSFKVTSSTIFAVYDASAHRDNKVTLGADNILKAMPSFEDTKQFIVTDEEGNVTSTTGVEASEIFVYVVNNRVVLVYQIIR
ncbi:MAG: S-layer homology domain-containing protein [Clostridia bacterium]|nr:S-layer homology domain-containing protein [Clostridia bacterium]